MLRFEVPRREGVFAFWLTPGGEIEAGESPAEAAVRELREELGLEVGVTGPVYTEATQFEHQGEMRDNMDFYFVARCRPEQPRLAGVTAEEIAAMREMRWWSVEAIGSSLADGERFFPADIVARVSELRT